MYLINPYVYNKSLKYHIAANDILSYPGYGTTLTDLQGSGLIAVMNNCTFDNVSNSIVFTGATGNKISLPDIMPFAKNDFTIEIWIKISSIPTSDKSFVTGGNYSIGVHNFATTFEMLVGTNNTLAFSPKSSLLTNTIMQIVVTRKASVFNAYINKVKSSGSPKIYDIYLAKATSNNNIGLYNNSQYPFVGNFYALKIYNKELSLDEIINSYNEFYR